DVYLGVLPIARASRTGARASDTGALASRSGTHASRTGALGSDTGELELGGTGDVFEWAVHMRRLPADANLQARLEARTLRREQVERIGERLALFHRDAPRGAHTVRWASFDVVAENCRDNA